MSNRLKVLREQRGKIVVEMRNILDTAAAEKRAVSDEETAKHEELFAKTEELRKQIAGEERQIELDREMAKKVDEEERAKNGNKPDDVKARQLEGCRSWLRGNRQGEGLAEFRALSVGVDTEGGHLVMPEMFVQQLIKFVDDAMFIRGRATKFQVPTATSLGVPSLDTDPDDADWTTELQTGSEDSSMAFGKRSLTPHPFAKRIKVSRDLLRQAVMPAESIVIARLGYKFALTEEKGFLTGNGNQRPLGLFTASANGIPTTRDVSTGNSTTAITFDGLINAKYSVKAQYWGAASWLFHRDTMKMISKLKDGEGQYLWRQSVREGEPDTVLGHPVDISENAPNTFTTGLYVGLFGDMSFYWIADALDMQMQRLDELYAETNQVGFIGRQATDGMPVLGEAFARVTLA